MRNEKMKDELKNDDEIVAQEGDITINMKELKTSLPKLVDELNNADIQVALKKLMLDIEVRLEIIQHTLKPILNDSIEVMDRGKETMRETNKWLGEVKELLDEIKNE